MNATSAASMATSVPPLPIAIPTSAWASAGESFTPSPTIITTAPSRWRAWTGVAPGHDERAGTQRSGKTRRGNRTLRTGLTQLVHAAARTKGTYLSALYQRLATHRGRKRAIMAVAHAIVVSAFHRLSHHEPYHELGANYFDEQRRDYLVNHLTRGIQRLGYHVPLEPVQPA